jgi:aldehyde:ferredoxin oxidoreductase
VIDEAEVQGLDVMSTGVVLAWATEALEKGLISTTETVGLELIWGDAPTYIEAIQRIVTQPTDFFRILARGVDHAATIYGGGDFALAFGGNEMPGYHTGPGAHIGYLTGARHSHLDSAGYSLDQKALTTDQPLSSPEMATALWEEEAWRQVLSSLVICFFARGVYTPDIIQKALQTIGLAYTPEELSKLGAEILNLKHQFKKREGFDLVSIRIPNRILETPSSLGSIDGDFVRQTLEEFDTRTDPNDN